MVGVFIVGSAFYIPKLVGFSIPDTDNCEQSLEYNVEIITRHQLSVDDAKKMTQLELGRIEDKREHQKVDFCLSDNELTKSITVLNPAQIYPAWMKKVPVYTKVGTYSTKQYNEKGQLLKEHPHLDKEVAMQRDLKRKFETEGLYVDAQFGNNRQDVMKHLQNQLPPEAEFSETASGFEVFMKNKHLVYDFDKKEIEKTIFENDKVVLFIRTHFEEGTDQTFYPSYTYVEKAERTKEELEYFKKIKLFRYSNIQKDGVSVSQDNPLSNEELIDENGGLRTVVTSNSMQLKLSPNPVANELKIKWTSTEGVAAIQIIDTAGKICWKGGENSDQNEVRVDVTQLPTGNYYVRMQSKNGRMVVEQFIKH